MSQLSGIDHRTTSAYHPRANGAAERPNHTIRQTLLKHVSENLDDWDLWVPFVQFSMNAKVTAITGSTPFTLMFARNSFPLPSIDPSASTVPAAAPSDSELQSWKARHEQLLSLV